MHKVNGLNPLLITTLMLVGCIAPPVENPTSPTTELVIESQPELPTESPTEQQAEPQQPQTESKTAPQSDLYYVDGVNGFNENPGTSVDEAWKTIQKAANVAAPGDKIIVLPGNYEERIMIDRSGESEAPIIFRASGRVITQGFTILADYITIQGFEITNTPNEAQDGWGIFVNGSSNIISNNFIQFATRGGIILFDQPEDESSTQNCIVQDNRLYRNALSGIVVSGENNLIERNEIWGTIQYHPKWTNPPDWVDADGIRFFGTGHVIRKNYIHDILYEVPENINPHIDCFQTWDGDYYHEQATNIILEQNLCINMQTQAPRESGQGFMIENANNLIIRNNIIQAYRSINAINSNSLTVVNNTMTNSLMLSSGNHPSIVSLAQTPNSVIKNNIFYNPLLHSIYFHDSVSEQGIDIGYNNYYRSDGVEPAGSPYPDDLWMIDPQFFDPTRGDFHLRESSALIDAGVELIEVKNDFEGNSRPSQTSHDIGAYEFVGDYSRYLSYFALITYFPFIAASP